MPLVVSIAKLPPSSSRAGGQLKLENIDQNLVRFNGPGDMDDPQNWSRNYKWLVTMIYALMTVNVCVPSGRLTVSIADFALKDFRIFRSDLVDPAYHREVRRDAEVAHLFTSLFLNRLRCRPDPVGACF